MKKTVLLMVLMMGAAAMARTLSVPTYVCNPGAVVHVPVSLDDAAGCACVDLRLTYDAQVLVPVKVEAGTLKRQFNDDSIMGYETAGMVNVALFATNDVGSVSGTVAVVTFRVREGTADLFSDLTLASVTLGKANGLRADTTANPTHVVHGMIRVASATASISRLEKAETVCADTTLGALTLSEGDGIAASDNLTPIIVTGDMSAAGTISVAAPASGWGTASYRLLATRITGLSFSAQGLTSEDGFSVTSETDGSGMTTYTANVTVGGALTVTTETAGGGLAEPSVATANKLRTIYRAELAADDAFAAELKGWKAKGVSVTGIRAKVTGTAKATDIPTFVDLGICGVPSFDSVLGIVEFTYTQPKLEIISFNPLGDGTATARVRVTPGTGNRITQQIQTGYLHVYGTSDLSTQMTKKNGVEFDLTPYTKNDSLGEAEMTISLGDSAFFKVKAETVEE